MPSAKLAIVLDDHPLVARGIADFLTGACQMDSALALSAADNLRALIDQNTAIALAIIDFWLADGASVGLIEHIKAECKFPILVISADDDQAVLRKAQAVGADGFLHKQETPEIFAKAVAALLAGETWFQPSADICQTGFNKELIVTVQELGLTPRQGEILALLLQALPNKRIAQRLSISEATVKEHVSAILDKLGARNRLEIITRFRGKKLAGLL